MISAASINDRIGASFDISSRDLLPPRLPPSPHLAENNILNNRKSDLPSVRTNTTKSSILLQDQQQIHSQQQQQPPPFHHTTKKLASKNMKQLMQFKRNFEAINRKVSESELTLE